MYKGPWRATDDGTVWVRATGGFDGVRWCGLTFAVEEGGEDGVFQGVVGSVLVGCDEGLEEREGILVGGKKGG